LALLRCGTCLAQSAGFSDALTNASILNGRLKSSGTAHGWFTGRRCLNGFAPKFALVEILRDSSIRTR
jgi:hypothetical protein